MIYIDNRENRAEFSSLEETLRMLNTPYKSVQLPIGDFIITGTPIEIVGQNGDCLFVVLERKSAPDFLQSLISGHLNNQLYKMSTMFKSSCLLVEGGIKKAMLSSNILPKTVYSAIVGAFLRHSNEGVSGSISVLQYDDEWELALILERTQSKLSDPKGLARLPVLELPPLSTDNPLVRMVACIPHIGQVTAVALVEKFGSLKSIMDATPDQLKEVQGIGNVLANQIHTFLRLE